MSDIQRRGVRRGMRSTFVSVTFVYALVDPRDGVVRYVGKADHPRRRLTSHLSRARREPALAVHRWLNELRIAGLRPQLQILEEVRDARPWAGRAVAGVAPWERAERRWIARYHATVLNEEQGGKPDYQQRARRERARRREG